MQEERRLQSTARERWLANQMQVAYSLVEVGGGIGCSGDNRLAKVGWDKRQVEDLVVVEYLVPYPATYRGGFDPFGSYYVPVASVGHGLRRGQMYVVVEGKEEDFEVCVEGGLAGSLQQLCYLALRRIQGRTYCLLE